MRGEVVPQTRISESHYKVWVCLNSITCAILTGECGCAAGLSEACKHVFALMHHVFLTVILPYLNMYYLQIPVSHILLKNLCILSNLVTITIPKYNTKYMLLELNMLILLYIYRKSHV